MIGFWDRILLGTIAIMFAVSASYLGFILGDRTVPVRSYIIEVVTPEVLPGDALLLRIAVDRTQLCPSQVADYLFDSTGLRWSLPVVSYPVPPGEIGHEEFMTSTRIPLGFPPGLTRFRRQVVFTCNLAQQINPVVDSIPDITFVVK